MSLLFQNESWISITGWVNYFHIKIIHIICNWEHTYLEWNEIRLHCKFWYFGVLVLLLNILLFMTCLQSTNNSLLLERSVALNYIHSTGQVIIFICWHNQSSGSCLETENTAGGVRHTDYVASSIRKSWQSLRRQAAVARSV
jgi:hypothetical protein